ncbi:MAG: T9SS type A sorting domain-containing protein, partial [Bacteroidota bacterium]|nr:T9SS type A sorting domain-containing protein [Bacteroidota bacterium]
YEQAVVTATLRNPSAVPVDSVRCSINLPNGVLLAAGETQVRIVRDLQPGSDATVSWNIAFVRDTASVLVSRRIRIDFAGAGSLQDCISEVIVAPPPVLPSDFVLGCSAPDTIVYQPAVNAYDPAPFLLRAEITNTGSTMLSNVRGTLTPAAELVLESGEALTKALGVDLGPGQSASIAWNCRGIPQAATTTARSTIRVESDGALVRSCGVETVLYHPPTNDSIDVAIACSGPDTLVFTGNGWDPNPFSYTVRITNLGTVTLTQVTASLSLGVNFALESGENSLKSLGAPLLPGNSATISWAVRALSATPSPGGVFDVQVTSAETGMRSCASTVFVEPEHYIFQMSIPDDIVGVMGESVRVPVLWNNPDDISLTELTLGVELDPAYVLVEKVSLPGGVLETWPAPVLDFPEPGIARISTSSDRAVDASGVLMYLHCRLLAQEGADGSFGVFRIPAEFRHDYFVLQDGVAAITIDGAITVAGDCVMPLDSETLLQVSNRPNPFNPLTTIIYHVPEELDGRHGTLEVRDMHGRVVARPFEGRVEAGSHALQFDGSRLPSGMYLYQLRVGSRAVTGKMLLAK